MAAATNIELYMRLNTELMSMVEQFTNLIKGTKEGEFLRVISGTHTTSPAPPADPRSPT